MNQLLANLRKTYFDNVASTVNCNDVQFVILTHILDDRPELLSAIGKLGDISLLIGIPYSINQATAENLKKEYKIAMPTLEQLYYCDYLVDLILTEIKPNKPLIILEIGGYFSKVLPQLHEKLGVNFLGVIEDTEAGHREYAKNSNKLPCPVISVARSELKETEDFLVGASCLFSTEKLLRTCGAPIEGKRALVLGFGKIGRGMAHSLLRHHCPVSVYDTNPIKRISALSEGFQTPSKENALREAEIIYGTTANFSIQESDFNLIKPGALLVSCSSKDIEFDLKYLEKNFKRTHLIEGLDFYQSEVTEFYLAANGKPINFLDGAVIGPILALVQAEIILAIKQVYQLEGKKGLFETSEEIRRQLAEKWLEVFCDNKSGRYNLKIT